ncbi:MAG TPA: ABC transporter ATP-binding protein, partial [Rhodanobacter sp.]|nr:ABC transporter ATP-binding protein [Rhodanobacter sp.]
TQAAKTQAAVEQPAMERAATTRPDAVIPADAGRRQIKPRRLSYKEQRELAALPDTIQRLETEQQQLHAAIEDPNLFRDDPARGSAVLERLQSLTEELEAAYARWHVLES